MFQPKNFMRRCAHKSVKLSLFKVTIDKGCSEPEITIDSLSSSLKRLAPSRLTQAALRPSATFWMRMTALAGRMTGLNESECGARGVRQMQFVAVARMEPPAARL